MTITPELIEQTIIDAIEDEYREKQRKPDKYISTTEVVQCLRRSYFARKYPLEIPSWSISALIGKYIHEVIESYIVNKFEGYIVNCEQTFYDDILSGTIDILLRDPEDMNSIVIDLKTTSKLPSEPYYHHMLQVNTYLHLSDSQVGYIVYIDKRFTKDVRRNLKYIKAFKVIFYNPYTASWSLRDYKLYQRMRERAEILRDCINSNRIPQREWTESCNTCEYLNRCIEV